MHGLNFKIGMPIYSLKCEFSGIKSSSVCKILNPLPEFDFNEWYHIVDDFITAYHLYSAL